MMSAISSPSSVFEFKLPDIGEGIHEGELLAWLVAVGDVVSEDTPLAEFMTDKVTVELPSPVAGRIKALHGTAGDTLHVGSLIVEIETATNAPIETNTPVSSVEPAVAVVESSPASTPSPSPVSSVSTNATTLGNVLAAPATRAMARQCGLALEQVQGTGKNGRITPNDVLLASQAKASTPVAPPAFAPIPASVPNAVAFGQDVVLPYSGIRKTIGQRLGDVKRTVPEFAFVEAFNVTALEALRHDLNRTLASEGKKLTLLPFILKAVAMALKQVPALNASLNEAAGTYTQFADVHVSLAVDAPQGLVVPVLRQVLGQNVLSLSDAVAQVSQKAREGKLAPSDQQGGTFTVSSIGAIGGLFGVPILNAPQAGILAVGKASKQPVVGPNDTIEVGYVLHACLTADHRIVDGADAARFMNRVKHLLENPSYLLAC